MAYIDWSDSFKIDIVQIDAQHQNLVKILNQLYESIHSGKDKDIIPKTLMEMINYSIIHFRTEEKLMIQHKYPDYDKHKEKHEYFIEEIKKFTFEIQKGNLEIANTIASFLKDWLTTHIQETDSAYGPFLKGKGVK
ncbi:MAG TPA: bacteriohemerythrin [Candidatus Hydrogenedens sp.]|nr:bacteriohemerythrin [Candidatus Hydrogenedens sp.]HOL21141.1 bacteriohemerythrin [Candidatus Hydrogenedens sp.]HPP59812.1 bacteriohemerythrin [Candidatus Hydrogenedens sp.]